MREYRAQQKTKAKKLGASITRTSHHTEQHDDGVARINKQTVYPMVTTEPPATEEAGEAKINVSHCDGVSAKRADSWMDGMVGMNLINFMIGYKINYV